MYVWMYVFSLASASIDSGGRKGLPDDRLADIRGDEQ